MSFAETLWNEFGSVDLDDLPADVAQVGKQCLIDWVGCALSGSTQPTAALLRDALWPGETPTRGAASVLGTTATGDARAAAFANGTAGHALDYDDTNRIGGLHMTAPLAPAALALAQATGASGRELLVALIIGAEIECRYGAAIPRSHYDRGWHSTSMIGPFGAAAAGARLLGLDARQFAVAAGVAASQASGVQANFGTMTKPLHAGLAAQAGVTAALLAQRGFSASDTAFEGFRGLAVASSDGGADLEYSGPAWALPETLFKFHASCHGSHPTIECLRQLAADGLGVDDIESVELRIHPSIADVCRVIEPAHDLETKFSLPVVFAAAAHGYDTADPATFTMGLLADPRVDALRRRVSIVRDPAESPTGTATEVVLRDAGRLRAGYDLLGAPIELDRQAVALHGKFLRLAEPVIGDRAKAAADAIWSVEHIGDLAELTDLLLPA